MVPVQYDCNVYSGTMLDDTENSFYLVPQQGLKGTSKPVKYIVYQNENESLSGGYSGLTMDNLKNLTNQMSWLYPTATKVCYLLPAFVACTGQPWPHLTISLDLTCNISLPVTHRL